MKKLLFAAILAGPACLVAQELPYTFTAFNDPYSALESPVSLNNGEIWDDPEYVVTVGFTFDMMGEQFDQLAFAGVGGQLVPVLSETQLGIVMIYLSDIADAGALTGETESGINYQVDGTAPYRIFKLEWDNVGFYYEIEGNGTANNRISFQLWLYETTNDIEYRFGPNTIKDTEIHDLGKPLSGICKNFDLVSDDSAEGVWLLAGNPDSPVVALYTDFTMAPTLEQMLDHDPQSGTVYRFATGVVGMTEAETPVPFAVFPVPAGDQLFVNYQGAAPQPYTITDACGRIVGSGLVNSGLNTVQTSGLAEGVYQIQIGSSAKRFIRN